MESTHIIENEICYIVYKEDTKLEESRDFVDNLPQILNTEGLKGVILDLNMIDMLNSSGIGILAHIGKTVGTRGLGFSVVANPYVSNILNVVGLNRIFEIVDEVSEAREAIESGNAIPIPG